MPSTSLQRLGQRRRRERPGGDDGEPGRDGRHLLADEADAAARLRPRAVSPSANRVAVDGEAGARGHLVRVGDPHDERAELPHLLLQEPDGGLERGVAEGVRAHQLAELVGGVRRGAAHGRIS